MEPKAARREQRKQKSALVVQVFITFSQGVATMAGFSVIWGMGWGGAAVPNVGCRQLMFILSSQQPSGLRLPFWTGRECGQ